MLTTYMGMPGGRTSDTFSDAFKLLKKDFNIPILFENSNGAGKNA